MLTTESIIMDIAIGFFSTDLSKAVCPGFIFLEFGRVIGMRFG